MKNSIPFIYDIINDNIPKLIVGAFHQLHKCNPAYQVQVYGSYPLMSDWNLLNLKINDPNKKEYDKSIVWEHLKLFAEGFKHGYSNFENEIIQSRSSIFNNADNYNQLIFDYVTGNMGINGANILSPNYGGNFPERIEKGAHTFSGWKDSGTKAGYLYRAWILIFNNHRLFKSLFEKNDTVEPKLSTSNGYPSLSLKEIALLFRYKNEDIDSQNADEIALMYGHKSGKKLSLIYNAYNKSNDRCGDSGSPTKNKNQFKRIEKIIPYLPESAKIKAEDELKILEGIIHKNY